MNKITSAKISLIDKIRQTGFILEHEVATLLEEKGWSVIHNRYYLDDVVVQQREIDMVAYKTLLKGDFRLVTALIISCKKSDLYDWVFLTRKAPAMNYNINLFPISFTSNIDAFNFEYKLIDWSNDVKEQKSAISKLIKRLYQYDEAVFAFKEFKDSNDKGRSDSAMFDSISSLIKAQSFEIRSLKNRRKADEKYIYNFNLLSISDVNFIKLLFDKEVIEQKSIDRINYINRFLVNGEEQHSKIDFINFNTLGKAINDYDTLHKLNISFADILEKKFYNNIWSTERIKLIIEKNGSKLLLQLKSKIYDTSVVINDSDFMYLEFEKSAKILSIDCSVSQEINEYFNNKGHITSFTKKWLNDFLKYTGPFKFEDIFPF